MSHNRRGFSEEDRFSRQSRQQLHSTHLAQNPVSFDTTAARANSFEKPNGPDVPIARANGPG